MVLVKTQMTLLCIYSPSGMTPFADGIGKTIIPVPNVAERSKPNDVSELRASDGRARPARVFHSEEKTRPENFFPREP